MAQDFQTNTNITEIMQTAYIDYSMSVIISRALPDVRDGLKPVQRRILYAMMQEGLLHNRPFDKCAGVVGEVLKNYHPHGDSSVYDTLVRLAQHWVMRYPLIEPQGNFGSVDGDPPAAYRYTECRLRNIAEELLNNIDEDTVDFVPNYKESSTEPSVLPASLPNLLLNGSTGIAVGMTTNIPPHNIDELIDGICLLIENPSVPIDDLMDVIKGPDFPTGGMILGTKGIESYLRTGRGIVKTRARLSVEETPSGREQIIITEIPYNVNRNTLVKKMADLVGEKVLDGVSDLRDESDENTRIVIDLKKGEVARVTINKLYKHTALESSFGVILLALDKRRPKQMNIKEMLECYLEHRREVIYRRTQYQLRKAEDRAHILEGYKIALDNMDEIVRIIRASSSRDEARESLMDKFPLSERQTNAILDLRLYQLTGLERQKIEEEYAQVIQTIERLRAILDNESILLEVIKKELLELKEKYSSPRKSEIVPWEGEMRMEDIIAKEGCIVTVSEQNFIKRTSLSEYRSQKRGGRGIIGGNAYEKDFVRHLFTASTHDTILFFMNNGRLYIQKAYEIPEGGRTSKGRSIANMLELQEDERVAAMICIEDFRDDQYLVFATRQGLIKKTRLDAYKNIRRVGLKGILLRDEDDLIGVRLTTGDDHIMLVTKSGMAIRFHESEIRDMGRVSSGNRGIRLRDGDAVESLEIVQPGANLLIAGENGMGKRTSFDEFRDQKRGGYGLTAIKTDSTVCAALSVDDTDEIIMLTASGQTVRCPIEGIRIIGRSTKGVRLVNLNEKDRLIRIARVIDADENAEGLEDEESDETAEGESVELIDSPSEASAPESPDPLDLPESNPDEDEEDRT
ncbi:MAG: DNA gyrase subunit A [Opitutales bacterium]|nr:DNA gyrase subunit A [Opitutales bacterium]